jgi:hypothetical protein
MYTALLKSHSGLRWVLLFSFISSIIILFRASKKGTSFKAVKPYVLITLIITHVQFIIGLALYFTSPKVIFAGTAMKDSVQRFFLVEHISLMLIAIILVTIGYSKWKKATQASKAMRSLFNYYLIALILILVSIPWPFRIAGSAWF